MYSAISRTKKFGQYIFYHNKLSHKETLKWYHQVDLFAFASSCETFGISLLEAMASGLPIASSNRGPMVEILKDAGIYFNPENPTSIANSLKMLLLDF